MELKDTLIDGRYHILEQLGTGRMSLVFKAIDRLTNREIALKIMKEEVTSTHIEDIIRFKREIEIVTKFNHPNIIKLFSCGEFENKPYLVMEVLPEGNVRDLLQRNHPFHYLETVEIIKQLTEALIYVHHHGIIHRDLKPGNIFIAQKTGRLKAKLVDFGVALVMEYGAFKGTAEVIGTFGYMSPEATGILNNRLDERSDLYSLGVVFFHLLTNELPFQGDNVNQIIHRQVALVPPRPREKNPVIPEVLEAIILKLLQKDPDLRYQSARGLWADLERFQHGEWQFEIGSQDPKIKLTYQTRLVGREPELERVKAYIGQTKSGRGGICLIAGEAGIGKSKFIEEIRSIVYEMDGLSISGRCINCNNKTPYQPFKDAIDDYITKLEKEETASKSAIISRLRNHWSDLGEIIIQLNPRLEQYLGAPKKLAPLEAERENKRFLMVLADFFCNLACPAKICVLVLDDLQWADEGSLILLGEILRKIENSNLFILGTYRDNEIGNAHQGGAEHGLDRFINESKECGAGLSKIKLDTFDHERLNILVAHLLGEREEMAWKLSGYILDKSNGNPFFAIQIVRELIENKAISWKEGVWEEDWELINKMPVSSTMLSIILRRIENLTPEENDLLRKGAVIGREFDIHLLYQLTDLNLATVITLIDEFITQQLLERNNTKGKLLFVHDRIRDAFYHQITETKRKEIHLLIAKALERMNQNLDEVVFDLAHHYAEGDAQEKTLQYMLPAADKARETYANEESIKYYKIAINILENKKMRNSQWFQAQENLAKVYLTVGKNEEAITISEQLLPLAADALAKAGIYKKIGMAYFKKGDWGQCEEHLGKGLTLLGEKIPKNKFEITFSLVVELWRHLFSNLSPGFTHPKRPKTAKDEDKEIVQIYITLVWLYILVDIKKIPYNVLRMLNISEKKIGPSVELGQSLWAYAGACMAIPLLNSALKYHKKALTIREQLGDEWGIAQSLQLMGFIYSWTGNNKAAIKNFKQAETIFQKLGDVWELGTVFNGLGMVYYYYSDYDHCLELFSRYLESSRKLNDSFGISIALFLFSLVSIEKGEFRKAQEMLTEACKISLENKNWLAYCDSLIGIGYLELERNNYTGAIECLEQAKKVNQENHLLKPYTVKLFFRLADAQIKKFREDHINLKTPKAKKEMKKIFHLCRETIKETKPWRNNYGSALRVMANFYQLAGKNNQAEHYFLKSIEHDQKIGRKFELGKEFFEYGNFFASLHKNNQSKEYWWKAYEIFHDIGAKQYIEKIIVLLDGKPGKREFSDEVNTQERLKIGHRMDTVLTTSRYISSILDIDDLLQKIMDSTVELTGAERGLLLLYPEEGARKLEIKALCGISKEGLQENEFSSGRSIIAKVEKEKNPLIDMNTLANQELGTQSGVVLNGGGSVLCAPVINKGEMLGIIYLDHPEISGLFTKDDLNILGLISNQAGISIENARLYSKLKMDSREIEESQAKITKWNQELEQYIQEQTNELSKKNAELERMNQELLMLSHQLQEYSATVAELAITEERNRLAHDLHDSLGQLMALSISQFRVCGDLCLKAPSQAKEKLEKIIKLLRDGLSEIRYSITGLIPQKLRGDNLVDAMQSLIMDYQASGLTVDFSVEGSLVELEPQVLDAVFRACQEALTNSIKHGQAKEVMILLRFLDNTLKVYISDDGCGCKTIVKRLGLTGMGQRIKNLNGNLDYGSDGERGFNLRIEIPLAQKSASPVTNQASHL